MRNAKPMKLSSTGIWKLFWIVLLCLPGWKEMHAQDPLPEQPPHDKNSGPVYSSSEMQKLMRFVEVEDPMPASFKNTQENRIDDPTGSLNAFWESLQRLDRPVRIVHIGDSHVRGHVFPYIMRKALEADFGSEAVVDQPVTYRSSGLAQETGVSGIVYHIMGINGATCASFSTPEDLHAVAGLDPDLIIVSFGTNEAHGRNYSAEEHRRQLTSFFTELKNRCPHAAFLLTTPPGAYMRSGRRGKTINTRTPRVVETEKRFAADNGLALWDLYDIAGGQERACRNWTAANMFQRDRIHFTQEGYVLQGLLLHEAFIKAYNDYVATKLD